jgi:hypothetical protein
MLGKHQLLPVTLAHDGPIPFAPCGCMDSACPTSTEGICRRNKHVRPTRRALRSLSQIMPCCSSSSPQVLLQYSAPLQVPQHQQACRTQRSQMNLLEGHRQDTALTCAVGMSGCACWLVGPWGSAKGSWTLHTVLLLERCRCWQMPAISWLWQCRGRLKLAAKTNPIAVLYANTFLECISESLRQGSCQAAAAPEHTFYRRPAPAAVPRWLALTRQNCRTA